MTVYALKMDLERISRAVKDREHGPHLVQLWARITGTMEKSGEFKKVGIK